MKKIFLLLCFALLGFLFSGISQAQNKKTEPNVVLLAADKYFNNFEYFLAAKKYAKVLKKSPNNAYAMYQLAECSRYYYNYKDAELYYEKVSKKFKNDYPLARFWYASTLKDNGNYTKAIYQFEKFRNETTNTNLEVELFREKAEQEIKGCYITMEEASRALPDFGIKSLPTPLNSVNSDYSPITLNNDSILILTSSRKGSSGSKKNNALGGSSSDVYQFKKTNNNQWEEVKSETDNFSKLNTPYNECSGSFTEDGKKYYFTRCDVVVKTDNLEDVTCAIYISHLKNGKWETPKLLNHNINAPGQWNSQPCVSPKGNILFFVSKRPGGIGMHDIWYSTCNYNDNWGPAINMGDKVNTLFMDVSPQYYPDQKALFFSSNGHGGHGGLDIFMTKEDEAFETCINIGYPFNSSRDDFYFILGNKEGYIASNRKGGVGNDDIYSFDIKDKKRFIQFLGDSIIIPNKALNILPKETERPITNKAIIASVDNSSMPDSKSITVDGRILSEKDKKPVQDLTILLVDTSGTTLKTATTDRRGYYKFSHLDGSKKYNLIFQNESISEKNEDQSYIAEKVNVKGSNAVASKHFFENIFFDFDSYKLRPEALKILDELVEYCKDDATVQLELFANTDSYGSSVYNKSLAANRGKVAMEYLVDKGLSQSSIVVNAIGENRSIATNDTELGRQLNRRVEFYILGGSAIHYNKATYVIESNKTVYSMAKEYDMSEEELIELNGLTDNSLPAFTPVRIKKKIVSNELGAPITHETALTGSTEENYTPEEEKAILKNQSINKNFNFKNPEYLKYIDSIENVPYQENHFIDYYTVRPNNALDVICQLYSIDKADLVRINHLDSEMLIIGQKLKIDFRLKNQNSKGYLVTEEDTIESLASRFQIPVSTLISINHLYGYTLQKEMMLKLSRE